MNAIAPVRRLTVLYDAECSLCAFLRDWLLRQPQLVPLEPVPAASEEARRRFPGLDHGATLDEITVVGDAGQVYRGPAAWVVTLWALREHRPLAHRLSTPSGRQVARGAGAPGAARRRAVGRPGVPARGRLVVPPRQRLELHRARLRRRHLRPSVAAPLLTLGSLPVPAKNDGPDDGATPTKSEQTRALILETAMRLFQERGYDKTTMRAIAKEAGVSVGNAYYYFAGKEHLIQGFYDRIAAEHQVAVREILDRERDLEARLAGVLRAWLDIAAPYHEFAVQFFKNAADPDSPLSPFSPESEHAREEAISVHREVLAGATKTKVPEELRDVLPELMWLSQMGLVLYWIFDRTEGRERSYRLAERGARLTARGVVLARFRVLRPLVREVHELFTEFLPGMTNAIPDPAARRRSDP